MRMRFGHTVPAPAIVILISAIPSSLPAVDAPNAHEACSLISEQSELPTESIERILARHSASGEAERPLSDECASALACLLEARRLVDGEEQEGSAASGGDPSRVCRRLEQAGVLSSASVERFAEKGEMDSACRSFLDCLLRSATEPVAEGESWKERFERICAQIEIAETLTREELEELIRECDALLEELQTLQAPGARVYVFRLEKCRDFFRYTLDLREAGHAAEPE
jgi:polyhydroxyalkanoate synthesis regulator phasin